MSGPGNLAAAPFHVVLGQPQPAIAIACGDNHSCAIGKDGSLWCWGSNYSGQIGNGSDNGAKVTPQQILGPGRWTRCGPARPRRARG